MLDLSSLQLAAYTAQDLILIIGALGGVLLALGKLYVDNSRTKIALDAALLKIAEQATDIAGLKAGLATLDADLRDCTSQLETASPPLYRRRKPAAPADTAAHDRASWLP